MKGFLSFRRMLLACTAALACTASAVPPVGLGVDAGAVGALGAAPPPAYAAPDPLLPQAAPQSTTTTTVQITDRMTWWQVVGVVAIGIGAPVVTGYFGFRVAMRRQQDNSVAQRDAADLTALQARDRAYADLLALLTSNTEQYTVVVGENAANKARLEGIEARQVAREERERGLIAKVAALETHLNSCGGGQPCPLSQYRSNP